MDVKGIGDRNRKNNNLQKINPTKRRQKHWKTAHTHAPLNKSLHCELALFSKRQFIQCNQYFFLFLCFKNLILIL